VQNLTPASRKRFVSLPPTSPVDLIATLALVLDDAAGRSNRAFRSVQHSIARQSSAAATV
jgi:hypothetical protein